MTGTGFADFLLRDRADVIQSRIRGSGIASILSVKHSDRFLGFAFIAVTYYPPSVFPPLNIILEFQRQRYGRPLMGYWTFLGREDAASLIEENVSLPVMPRMCNFSSTCSPLARGKNQIDSFLDVFYADDPKIWKTYMNLPGELETFIRQKKRFSRASYLTPEVRVVLKKLGTSAKAP